MCTPAVGSSSLAHIHYYNKETLQEKQPLSLSSFVRHGPADCDLVWRASG
jgi:hypothetical protein